MDIISKIDCIKFLETEITWLEKNQKFQLHAKKRLKIYKKIKTLLTEQKA
jgi:hypothetical protein